MKRIMIIMLALLLVGCSSSKTESLPKEETFIVGMECNYAPFNWMQINANDTAVQLADGSYCDGYDVVMAQAIADGLGKTLVIKSIAWEGLEPALNSGEIDAIIAGMTETPERAENADFTSPYYESEMVIITKNDSEYASATSIQEFEGARVLGQLNTTYDDIIAQIDGVIHATPLASYPMMIMALQNGEVDALTAELPVATGTVAAHNNLVIVRFADGLGFEVDTTVSIALKKGNTDLLNVIQAILDDISLEERNDWMIDATNRQPAIDE